MGNHRNGNYVEGGTMIYCGETIIDGTLYSVFVTEDGRTIYLP